MAGSRASVASADYDQDFVVWLNAHAEFLRQGQWEQIDRDHLVEELEAMAKRERRELLSRLSVLIMHLLKWQFQASRRSRSWQNTIMTQRMDVLDVLADSPSLQPFLHERLPSVYAKARLQAEVETGMDAQQFPEQCPYSVAQILATDFWPDA